MLTLPASPVTASTGNSATVPVAETGLSKPFVNSAIETLFSMREWASTLSVMMSKGYPIADSISDYRARTAKDFALANASASTESDRNALQLLTYEFNELKSWSENLMKEKNSMNAAKYTMSPDALINDPSSQKLLHCWQFLGPMLASGRFEDNGSCR